MEQKMRLAALVAGALNILFCALCIYFTRALFTGHDADFWLHLQIFATGSTSLVVQVVGLYGIVRRGASAVRIQLYTLVALSLFFVIRAFANILFWLFVGWNFALLFVLLNYLNEAKRERPDCCREGQLMSMLLLLLLQANRSATAKNNKA